MLKFDLKGQCVVLRPIPITLFFINLLSGWSCCRWRWNARWCRGIGCQFLFLTCALVVSNIEAVSIPANAAIFSIFYWVDKRLHSHVVVAVGLHKVDDVETIGAIASRVRDLEKVPLSETIRSIVILQVEIVLRICDLDRTAQIARFKPRLENYCLIQRIFLFIIRR